MRHLLNNDERPVVRGPHYGERPAWLTLAVLSLFGLLALAVVSCGGGATGEQREEPTEHETESGSEVGSGGTGMGKEQAAVDLDHPSRGDANAPVVLTEYADYQ